jgi:hypothetical protein
MKFYHQFKINQAKELSIYCLGLVNLAPFDRKDIETTDNFPQFLKGIALI